MKRPLSWLPEAPSSLGANDIIEIQQSGSAMRYKMYVSNLVAGLYEKLFPKNSGGRNAIELIEDRLANTMKPYTPAPATDKASLVLPGEEKGEENFITVEAATAGVAGNGISVTVEDSGGISHPLELSTVGSAITITLETNAERIPVSTLADITDAITNDSNPSYNAGVSALITATYTGTGKMVLHANGVKNLSGGANNGTVAAKGATMFDGDYIYIAIGDCDGSTDMSNWKKVALTAFDAE